MSSVLLALLLGFPLSGLAADKVLLKENHAIEGNILAEKSDLIVIDVGYTAMTIPRDQITRIIRAATGETKSRDEEPQADRGQDQRKSQYLYRTAKNRPARQSVQALSSQLGESVVQVRTPGGLGSGFFINQEGYLITNFHVIEGETHITIEVYHQTNGQLEPRIYKEVKIVAMNKFADLALLKIENAEANHFSPVQLGEADTLSVGDRVFAIGSPLGLERTVTEGILSTKTRQVEGSLYLQTTAQINPGNSGGPLFNLHGEVIGVTNMKMAFGEGLGFAIPVEQVKYFLEHRDAFAYDNDNPNNPYRYLQPPSRTQRSGEGT